MLLLLLAAEVGAFVDSDELVPVDELFVDGSSLATVTAGDGGGFSREQMGSYDEIYVMVSNIGSNFRACIFRCFWRTTVSQMCVCTTVHLFFENLDPRAHCMCNNVSLPFLHFRPAILCTHTHVFG